MNRLPYTPPVGNETSFSTCPRVLKALAAVEQKHRSFFLTYFQIVQLRQAERGHMNEVFSSKARYRPTLLERLIDDDAKKSSEINTMRQVTAEEMKDSVACDLEALLNSRCAMSEDLFKWYPESLKSICSYGMGDFVGRSLANPADRNHICRSLERTIDVHERRLKQVRITLELDSRTTNRLRFTIHALLVVHPSMETVHFDALLHPATLNYSVNRSTRSLGI